MTSFHEIAVPHQDIYDGNLKLDTYATKLWEVFNNQGPEEYRDSKTFFQKTYSTDNLEEIVSSVHSRLDGGGVTISGTSRPRSAVEKPTRSYVFITSS